MQGNTNAVGLNKSDILDAENNFTRTQTICSTPEDTVNHYKLILSENQLRMYHKWDDADQHHFLNDLIDFNENFARINSTTIEDSTGKLKTQCNFGSYIISPSQLKISSEFNVEEDANPWLSIDSNGISWNGLNIIDTTTNKLALSAMPYTEGANITISNTGVISAAGVTIDSEFNSSSNNPLANSVITNYLQGSSLALGGSANVGSMAVALGPSSIAADYSTAVGHGAISRGASTAVGYGAKAELNGIALGKDAVSNANGAVQLGFGTNAESNTLQFRSYQLLDATGLIPVARIPNTIARAADVVVDQIYDATSSYAQSGVAIAGAISGKQDTSNLVTAISSSSTDTQYPSAKCVYDIIGNLETILAAL